MKKETWKMVIQMEVSVRQRLVQITMGEQLLIITINMAVTSVLVPTDKKVGSDNALLRHHSRSTLLVAIL